MRIAPRSTSLLAGPLRIRPNDPREERRSFAQDFAYRLNSPRACRQMLGQVPREQVIKMHRHAWAFRDAVSAIGINHEVKRFPEFDQFVHQQLRPLLVNVVVAGAVHNQQMAL